MIIKLSLIIIYPPEHLWLLEQITIRSCSTIKQEVMYINFPFPPNSAQMEWIITWSSFIRELREQFKLLINT